VADAVVRSCATCAHRRGLTIGWDWRCAAVLPRFQASVDPVTGDHTAAVLESCGEARRERHHPQDPIFRWPARAAGAGSGFGQCGPDGTLWAPRPRRWPDIAMRVAIILAAGAIGFFLASAVRQGLGW
jgi:hypothetical protein